MVQGGKERACERRNAARAETEELRPACSAAVPVSFSPGRLSAASRGAAGARVAWHPMIICQLQSVIVHSRFFIPRHPATQQRATGQVYHTMRVHEYPSLGGGGAFWSKV